MYYIYPGKLDLGAGWKLSYNPSVLKQSRFMFEVIPRALSELTYDKCLVDYPSFQHWAKLWLTQHLQWYSIKFQFQPTSDNNYANLFHKLYINVVHLLGVFLGCANIRSSLHKVPFSNLIPFLSHLSQDLPPFPPQQVWLPRPCTMLPAASQGSFN